MKIQFEKLDDNTGIVTVSGKNKHGQPFMVQDVLQPIIYEALQQVKNRDLADGEVECEHDYQLESSEYFVDRFVCKKCSRAE